MEDIFDLANIKLKYVLAQRLPSGNTRYRFRRDGKLTALPNDPSSKEFMDAYRALRFGTEPPKKVDAGLHGSMMWLINEYCDHMRSMVESDQLSPLTLNQRTNLLRRLATKYPNKDAFEMPSRKIREIMNDMSATPGAANNMLKSLRAMYRWAIVSGKTDENPTDGIERFRIETNGFQAWTVADLRTYMKKHDLGTQAHLTLMLLVFTACRRSDVVRLGRQHIKVIDGVSCMSFTQSKGGNKERQRVTIPILKPLEDAINTPVAGEMTFLMNAWGRPYSAKGFGSKFKTWTTAAGIGHLGMHGIRKAAGALLAEAGCTEYEVMAIHGHSDAKTSAIYTKTADRFALAKSAMEKFATVRL